MDTIVERDSSSSGMTAVVAILAIVVIVGLALYALRIYPFNAFAENSEAPPTVNVNIDGSLAE